MPRERAASEIASNGYCHHLAHPRPIPPCKLRLSRHALQYISTLERAMLPNTLEEKSACDITAPQPVERGLNDRLSDFNKRWHRDARYSIYASPPFNTSDKPVFMARWLPHQSAAAIQQKWNAINAAKNHGLTFCSLHFGLQLEMPVSRPAVQGDARVGDLLLVQVTQATHRPNVTRGFWLIALVTAADKGRVVGYEDRRGSQAGIPKQSILIPLDQLDAGAAEQTLAEHDSRKTLFKGEYSSPSNVLHVLRPALRKLAPSCHADGDFMSLIDNYCNQSYESHTDNRARQGMVS